MKRTSLRPRTALALGLSVPLAVVLATGVVGAAVATARPAHASQPASASWPAHTGRAEGGRGVPRRVYAPYFETWQNNSLPVLASKSGAHYLTLAFLQTPKRGSCSVAWNGDPQRNRQAERQGGSRAERRALHADRSSYGLFVPILLGQYPN